MQIVKIDHNYRGRIRVFGKPGELMGYMLTVHDADTGEVIDNVTDIELSIGVGHRNEARVTIGHEVDVTANCVNVTKAILEKYEIN